jgi:Uma2 family endonuclease
MQIQHPKLIVEVLSESTEAADRGHKFEEYRRIAEFEEYLLLDAERVAADHFRRRDGVWVFMSYAAGDVVTLESIGLTCPLDAFYRRTSLIQP